MVPRLNAAGIAFAQRGERAPGHDAGPTHSFLPVSVVAGGGLVVTHRDGAGHAPATQWRGTQLELHAASTWGRRLSYHAALGWPDRGEDLESETAFVQWNDVVSNGALNVRAGRFSAEAPFLSPERRTTLAGYLSPIRFEARGLELNGLRSGWGYAAGLSLSDRDSMGGPSPGPIRPRFEDSYLRLGHTRGTTAIAAQMLFDRQNSHLATLTWVQHLRLQLAATLGPPRFAVIPCYVFDRFDDRPSAGIHERHQDYLLEVVAVPDAAARWAVTARYEHDYRTRNRFDPERHRQLTVFDLRWRAIGATHVGVEWAHTQDPPPVGRREEFDAFAQSSW